MLLKNTSVYPDEAVRRIVLFAADLISISNVAINVKNCRSKHRVYRGRAYRDVPPMSPWRNTRYPDSIPPRARYLITCGIAGPERFPHYEPKRGAYFEWDLATWQEALVHLVAHELMHIQQYRARARASEPECERYALQRLTAWRVT